MSERLDNVYEEYLNMDGATRIGRAKIAASRILHYFIHDCLLSKEEAVVSLLSIIKLFVSYDQLVSNEECELFNKVIGTSFSLEKFKSIVDGEIDEGLVDDLDAVIDAFPVLLKAEVCILGLIFISADGDISEKEKEIFEKILN